jgi:hypothetical protein
MIVEIAEDGSDLSKMSFGDLQSLRPLPLLPNLRFMNQHIVICKLMHAKETGGAIIPNACGGVLRLHLCSSAASC